MKKHANTLQYLCKCDKNVANAIVKHGKPDLINCFSEISTNVLNGNVKLSQAQKNKLSKYKNYIRKLATKSTSQATKKRILQQGGFIGALLSPLLKGVIGPMLTGLLTSKSG